MNKIDWFVARRDNSGVVVEVRDGYETREQAEAAAFELNRVHGVAAYFTVVHKLSGNLVDMSKWSVGWRNLTARRRWRPRSERKQFA